MSRLEDFTFRFLTQQAVINRAAQMIAGIDGIIVELGLGKGRSFDHIRERLPQRDIYVFDRELSCEPEFAPPSEFWVFGDIVETLPLFCQRYSGQAVFIHSDIGSRHRDDDIPLVQFVSDHLGGLLREGGIVASDRPMPGTGWADLPSLREMEQFPYYMYRK
mgnify:CR=1 FL=1